MLKTCLLECSVFKQFRSHGAGLGDRPNYNDVSINLMIMKSPNRFRGVLGDEGKTIPTTTERIPLFCLGKTFNFYVKLADIQKTCTEQVCRQLLTEDRAEKTLPLDGAALRN